MTKNPELLHGWLTIFWRDSFQSTAAHCATTNVTVFPGLDLESLIQGKEPAAQLRKNSDCYVQNVFFWHLIAVKEK